MRQHLWKSKKCLSKCLRSLPRGCCRCSCETPWLSQDSPTHPKARADNKQVPPTACGLGLSLPQ